MVQLKVTGMTCNHCVMHVTKALQSVPGVKKATVNLQRGEALVDGTPSIPALVEAVKGAGYGAEETAA